MRGCPDCDCLKEQVEGNSEFEVIEISSSVPKLKEFIRLRDASAAFEAAKRQGSIGIPCFVKEDGTVTLDPEAVGLDPTLRPAGPACSIDGTGC